MDTYIGIDLGSSSIKAIALDERGELVATAQRRQSIQTGPGGEAEQSPVTWHQLAGECLTQLCAKLSASGHHPAAVAATGQMNGPVLLDANGEPLGPVQMWCDTRCAAECRALESEIGTDDLLKITGHTAVTGYTAPKLMWIGKHQPQQLKSAAHLIFPKDTLTKALTGEILSDLSDASNSLLLDIRKARWDERIVDCLALNGIALPPLASSGEVAGHVSSEGQRWSGLPEGTAVAAGAGDSIAVALGAGISGPTAVQIVLGTAGNTNCVLTDPVIDPLGRVHTGYFVDSEHWICSGVQQSAGTSLQWWSQITGTDTSRLLAELDTADANPRIWFAPYLAGERTPHLDPSVRAAFVGLDTHTSRKEMTRAVLEGVAFSFRDAVEIFRSIGITPRSAVVGGGGAHSDLWCRIIAAILAVRIERSVADTTARGAAILAACAAGRFSHWREAATQWPCHTDAFEPESSQAARYEKAYQVFRRLYPTLAPLTACQKHGDWLRHEL